MSAQGLMFQTLLWEVGFQQGRIGLDHFPSGKHFHVVTSNVISLNSHCVCLTKNICEISDFETCRCCFCDWMGMLDLNGNTLTDHVSR